MSTPFRNYGKDELPEFGRKLLELSRPYNSDPKTIATNLFDTNPEFFKSVARKKAHGLPENDRNRIISNLTRQIQRHFTIANAYDVQSHFMYAYSNLFDCSLDYLYGRTDIRSSDLEVRDICKKLNLSEATVSALKDDSFEACWWSMVLESELFEELPRLWNGMVHEKSIEYIHKQRAITTDEFLNKLESAENLTQRETIINPYFQAMSRAQTASDAYYGYLYKLSNTITNFFEAQIKKQIEIWENSP